MTDATIRIKGRNEIGPAVRSAERDLKKLAQTGELVGKFLRGGGIVIALRMFEQLAENAEEASRAIGDQGTAGALKKLNKEIDTLKSKGLNLIGKVLGSIYIAARGSELEKITQQIGNLRQELELLKQSGATQGPGVVDRERRLAELEGRQATLLAQAAAEAAKFDRAGPTKNIGRGGGGGSILIDEDDVARMEKEAAEAATAAAKAAAEAWEKTLHDAARRGSLQLVLSAQDMDAFEESVKEMSDKVEQDLEDMENPVKETTEKWTVYAEQAARNMQDALAQFLFDPFADGLKGMLAGFLDVIRQMVAQAAASSIFEGMASTFTGSVGKFLFGRAAGGPVAGGQPYIVGERGAELFVPSTSGTIVPNGQMGMGSFTYHIDARGGDSGKILAMMPAILKQAQAETVNRIRDLQRRGRI